LAFPENAGNRDETQLELGGRQIIPSLSQTHSIATMKKIISLSAVLLSLSFSLTAVAQSVASDGQQPQETAPLKVLLVAGGCCHDYETQSKLLKEGIEKRIRAEVTIALGSNNKTDATFEIYEADDWATGYDVVVHDECSANVIEKPYVERILAAHREGTPAVNLHCAMHSYRWGDFRTAVEPGAENAGWYEMLGLQSTSHGPQIPIRVEFLEAEHALTKGLEDWTTINEELYNVVRVFSRTTPLIRGVQTFPPNKKALEADPNSKGKESAEVIAWTNEYGPKKTKIFCTSLGHNNETVGDDRYLDLVVRGLLWTTGNLTDEGKPAAAYLKK